MNKISVAIVDDNLAWLELYQAILSREADIEIAGIGKDGIEAERIVQQTKPDVIILDLYMPRLDDGFQTIPIIRRVSPKTKIIVATGAASLRVAGLLELGVSEVVLKGGEVVDGVAHGGKFIKDLIIAIYNAAKEPSKTFNQVKFIIVGQGSVGKTSILHR